MALGSELESPPVWHVDAMLMPARNERITHFEAVEGTKPGVA